MLRQLVLILGQISKTNVAKPRLVHLGIATKQTTVPLNRTPNHPRLREKERELMPRHPFRIHAIIHKQKSTNLRPKAEVTFPYP